MLQRTGGLLGLADLVAREQAGQALASWWQDGDRVPLERCWEEPKLVHEYMSVVLGEARAEAEELLTLAPRVAMRRLCSIGPGNGLVELFMLKEGGVDQLLCVDVEETVEHAHGWASQGSGYASLSKLRVIMSENHVSPGRIQFCNLQKPRFHTFRSIF